MLPTVSQQLQSIKRRMEETIIPALPSSEKFAKNRSLHLDNSELADGNPRVPAPLRSGREHRISRVAPKHDQSRSPSGAWRKNVGCDSKCDLETGPLTIRRRDPTFYDLSKRLDDSRSFPANSIPHCPHTTAGGQSDRRSVFRRCDTDRGYVNSRLTNELGIPRAPRTLERYRRGRPRTEAQKCQCLEEEIREHVPLTK